MNPLTAQLSHAAFPDLANAIRDRAERITREADEVLRDALPQLDRLTTDELRDSVPKILLSIADALDSADPRKIEGLIRQAPVQGLTRFHQRYGVIEVMQEDRLLRAAIVAQVEDALARQMNVSEAAALHATVDVMLQQAVVALVDEQKSELRQAAERELKYLSFLSHDLNNDLSSVVLMLKLLRSELVGANCSPAALKLIDDANRSVHQTVAGMRRLLEHERLRKGGVGTERRPVDLKAFLSDLAREFATEATQKGLQLTVHAPVPVCRANRSRSRIAGDAEPDRQRPEYAGGGTVQLCAERREDGPKTRWAIGVADEGPGIAADQLDRIFDAFQRGTAFGHEGVGLGLAIASQAAKLLDAQLTVQSDVGKGSVFWLLLQFE